VAPQGFEENLAGLAYDRDEHGGRSARMELARKTDEAALRDIVPGNATACPGAPSALINSSFFLSGMTQGFQKVSN
jgi:hypothetical protein